MPGNARPGRWVRVHEVDLPETLDRLPIGVAVLLRDADGTGDHRALVDQVDRDADGRRYWLLLLGPRVALSEAHRTLDVLFDFVVTSGETVVITRRGNPVARMEKWPPLEAGGGPDSAQPRPPGPTTGGLRSASVGLVGESGEVEDLDLS